MAQPAWRLRLQPQLLPRAPLRSHRRVPASPRQRTTPCSLALRC